MSLNTRERISGAFFGLGFTLRVQYLLRRVRNVLGRVPGSLWGLRNPRTLRAGIIAFRELGKSTSEDLEPQSSGFRV